MAGWYKSEDKKKGRKNTLSTEQVKFLIALPCYYCNVPKCGGVDRKDSSLGHEFYNSMPSCYACNMILGTLPFEGKKIMSESLKKLRESGILDSWSPPNPFKRK